LDFARIILPVSEPEWKGLGADRRKEVMPVKLMVSTQPYPATTIKKGG
jgi:hypothetical protein